MNKIDQNFRQRRIRLRRKVKLTKLRIEYFLKKYHSIEIELLLAYVLSKPKEFIFLHPGYNLPIYKLTHLQTLIKRRMAGEPVAYILGYKDFMGLRFKVSRDVLIPRPETEWVVEYLVKSEKLKVKSQRRKILDLGTGSGCIIISLANSLSSLEGRPQGRLRFYGSDISEAALKVAKQNAKAHKTKIKLMHSDLFNNIEGKFDIIAANLPYVPLKMLRKHLYVRRQFSADDPFASLRYEPAFALTDGSSTWQIYRRFFEQVGGHINSGGTIILEIDPASRKFLAQYQKKYLPSAQIKFYKDFNNFWRYAEIKIIPIPAAQIS